MAPRRSARLAADPKPSEPTLGKTKVGKPVGKKTTLKKVTSTTTKKGTTAKKAVPTNTTRTTTRTTTTKLTKLTTPTPTPTAVKPAKPFPCACVNKCAFKVLLKDRRIVLGRPEYDENTTVLCTCKVHFKCANRWAQSHNELPSVLPCGHPTTKRGADFWAVAVPGRWAETKKEEEQKKGGERKKEEKGRKTQLEEAEEFDSGSDLTDLED
jgi:hypothetical protein